LECISRSFPYAICVSTLIFSVRYAHPDPTFFSARYARGAPKAQTFQRATRATTKHAAELMCFTITGKNNHTTRRRTTHKSTCAAQGLKECCHDVKLSAYHQCGVEHSVALCMTDSGAPKTPTFQRATRAASEDAAELMCFTITGKNNHTTRRRTKSTCAEQSGEGNTLCQVKVGGVR
jgi:hypothetical protein